MRLSLRTLLFLTLALATVAACSSSSTWKPKPATGPFAAYAGNEDMWRGSVHSLEVRVPSASDPKSLSPSWKTITREVHADDKLPGLSKSDVARLVGQPLVGLRNGGWNVVPPMFRLLHPLDSEHALVLVYEKQEQSVQFLDFTTGKLTPAAIAGVPFDDWVMVSTVIPTARGLAAGEPSLAFALAPDGPDKMRLGIFDAHGNLLHGACGLPRAAEDADFSILHANHTNFVSTRDANGRPIVLAYDTNGRPIDLVLPPFVQLSRVDTEAEWFKGNDWILPPDETEFAIAIGEIDGEQLEDTRLYLPLGSDERPLTLPADCLGMVRLINFTNRKGSPLYVYTGADRGLAVDYPDCHSGWALVRQDDTGLVFEVGGGTAEQVVGASLAGDLPRYRHFWSVNRPLQLYRWTGNVGIDGRERTFRAVVPARAIGQRLDGNYEALDLQRGVVCDLFFGETDYRESIANLEIDLKNTDAMLVNTVSSHAVEQYEIQERVQAQYAADLQRKREEEQRLLAIQREEQRKAANAEYGRVGPQLREMFSDQYGTRARELLETCEYEQAGLWCEFYRRYDAYGWRQLRHAESVGMPHDWIRQRLAVLQAEDAKNAAHEAGIDPNYEVFSWDAVFSAWHIQNQSRNSRVEVIHDRGLTKIIRYD